MNELMTTQEVADLLRTSPSTLHHWRYKNRGPRAFNTGRQVLYRRSDVELWISERFAAEARAL